MPFPPDPYSSITDPATILARVSPDDALFLRHLVTTRKGIVDLVLSNLFHHFIHELRSLGLDPSRDSDVAWHIDHPTLDVITRVLASTTFGGRDRGDIGEVSSQHDSNGTGGIHQTLCDDAQQRPDAPSSTSPRGPEPRSGAQANERKEKGQRSPSDGVTGLDRVMEQLKELL